MHAPCQFVPQAARRAKEAFFQEQRRCKNFFCDPDAGETGLTTLVADTRPSVVGNCVFTLRKPGFHQPGDRFPSLVMRSWSRSTPRDEGHLGPRRDRLSCGSLRRRRHHWSSTVANHSSPPLP